MGGKEFTSKGRLTYRTSLTSQTFTLAGTMIGEDFIAATGIEELGHEFMPRGKKKKRVIENSPPLVRGRKRRGREISHSPVRRLTTTSSPESIHFEEAKMVEQNNRNVSDTIMYPSYLSYWHRFVRRASREMYLLLRFGQHWHERSVGEQPWTESVTGSTRFYSRA
ncbi:uncharacterized protein G2W53_027443 [Senna tora]|uniref:Uncharacterized protein n=1 Tax=Senna tora TaxID=362788 RepID=A0A834WIF2_9FABA|nr:uncharacterized protein G2W53_027443 [Senna tora]